MTDMGASERLAAAERARERVRRGGRWPRWLYIGYAVAGFVYITICGLPVANGVFWAALAFWIAAVCGLTVFAMTRPVEPRGYGRRFTIAVAIWFPVWMAVFIVGTAFFRHNLAWWLPGAVVNSAIMLVAGVLDARAARR